MLFLYFWPERFNLRSWDTENDECDGDNQGKLLGRNEPQRPDRQGMDQEGI